jgi:hypothetical protein
MAETDHQQVFVGVPIGYLDSVLRRLEQRQLMVRQMLLALYDPWKPADTTCARPNSPPSGGVGDQAEVPFIV